MNFVELAFFFYMFIGLYMLNILIFLYFPNRKNLFDYPKGTPEPVSIIMPCYNESETIGEAIESLIALDYPKEMIEIIVVDDKSSDGSAEVVRRYTKKYANVKLIINKRNSGGAAEPTNIGIRAAKYDFIAVADADSTPEPTALRKMVGYLQADRKNGGVTCAVVSKKPNTFFQKLQAVEYSVIAFTRKLLDMVDAVYVTPGPFALYRKKTLIEIGLFDTKNMTQDIEIVWRMLSRGYHARMCLSAQVTTTTPLKLKDWFRQRVRWNIGGTQTLMKYKKYLFRKQMLGAFIIPYFSFSLFLGVFGLGLFTYLLIRRFIVTYLVTHYSLLANTALISMNDINLTPSILNFFGASLFFAGMWFTLMGLNIMKHPIFKNGNIFNVLFYMLVYLAIYPIVMITGAIKLLRGNYSW